MDGTRVGVGGEGGGDYKIEVDQAEVERETGTWPQWQGTFSQWILVTWDPHQFLIEEKSHGDLKINEC